MNLSDLNEITNTNYEGKIQKENDTVKCISDDSSFCITDDNKLCEYPEDSKRIDIVANKYKQPSESGDGIIKNVLEYMMDSADESNFGTAAGKCGRYNFGISASPLSIDEITKDKFEQVIACLDEHDVPSGAERWLIIPPIPELQEIIFDLRDTFGSIQFSLFTYNDLPHINGNRTIIFGHRDAVTFASSKPINELEAQDALIYGYKVVKPKYLGYIVMKFPSLRQWYVMPDTCGTP